MSGLSGSKVPTLPMADLIWVGEKATHMVEGARASSDANVPLGPWSFTLLIAAPS